MTEMILFRVAGGLSHLGLMHLITTNSIIWIRTIIKVSLRLLAGKTRPHCAGIRDYILYLLSNQRNN